ncbi:MAG: rhombosortase [Gammaproteobacteria bacterium]|nr:rhombosortase [Gammaproteobacteria bacterium]
MGETFGARRHPLRPIVAIVAVSSVVMAAMQAIPEAWQHLLRYDRPAVGAGEWWRLLSGNFVHLDWAHLALNLAGLWLGTWLFGADRSPRQWLAATLLTATTTGVGLWLFSPSVLWCVGLSGVLHGLMIVGFGGWALAGDRLALGLLGLVAAKMAWEQAGGDMPWAASLAGGRVITDAHVWGAIGGAAFLAVATVWKGRVARL